MPEQRWDAAGYGDIVRVQATADGRLTVLFADETWAELDGNRALPPGTAGARWSDVRVEGNGDYLEIPTAGEPVAVPWDAIRTLTDRAFAAHRIDLARQESRRVGNRLRELREARGLTAKELADRVGIAPQSLSRIELGQHGVTFTTLREILAALSCTLNDLLLPQPESSKEEAISGPRGAGRSR